MSSVMEATRTEVKVFEAAFGESILCDGVWHYLFSKGNMFVYDKVGYCDKTTCGNGIVEEVRGDNRRLPEKFLVDRGLRIRRPESIVYVKPGKDGGFLCAGGSSLLPSDIEQGVPLEKGRYVDLPDQSGKMYRLINPNGSWAEHIPLEKVQEIEETMISKYGILRKLIQDLYLNGTNLGSVDAILKWATEAQTILREKGFTHRTPAFQQLLKDPFSYKLREELGIPPKWPYPFYDQDIRSAVRTLGTLMGHN